MSPDYTRKQFLKALFLKQNRPESHTGQMVAYVRDPEGFLVEICTPMS